MDVQNVNQYTNTTFYHSVFLAALLVGNKIQNVCMPFIGVFIVVCEDCVQNNVQRWWGQWRGHQPEELSLTKHSLLKTTFRDSFEYEDMTSDMEIEKTRVLYKLNFINFQLRPCICSKYNIIINYFQLKML